MLAERMLVYVTYIGASGRADTRQDIYISGGGNGESAKLWFKNIDRNVGCVNFALCISGGFRFFACDLQGGGGMLGK
jgi:hypothetical protein